MAIITTNEGSIVIDNGTLSSEPKGTFSCKIIGDIVELTSQAGQKYSFNYSGTTVDGESSASAQELLEVLSSFSKGGTDPIPTGVQSISGNIVNNEDPLNPVVNIPADVARDSDLSGKLDVGTGDQSATTYRRGDGTWATPPNTNTTYAVIPEAEFNTGAATTLRTINAVSLNRDIQAKILSFLPTLPGYAEGAILTVTENGMEWVVPTP